MSDKEPIDIYNLGAKKKELLAAEKRRRQKEINDVRVILKTPEGRRYFWRLLRDCGLFQNSFHLNSNQTAFNEGKRDIGLGVLQDINEADPTVFAKMQNEYVSALKSKKEAEEND